MKLTDTRVLLKLLSKIMIDDNFILEYYNQTRCRKKWEKNMFKVFNKSIWMKKYLTIIAAVRRTNNVTNLVKKHKYCQESPHLVMSLQKERGHIVVIKVLALCPISSNDIKI